jgi:hypothetical protein
MITLTSTQAEHYLTPKGYEMIDHAIMNTGSRTIYDSLHLGAIDNIVDPAVAAGSIMYFQEQIPLLLEDVLNAEGMRAYDLLFRNYPVEADAAKTTLAQRLSTKHSNVRFAVSFGLFASLMSETEDSLQDDCILTPAAMMLTREHTIDDDIQRIRLFDLFQQYISTESEFSYGAIMMYLLKVFNAPDLTFKHIYHTRALPVFVQMMRNIPKTELDDVIARFESWMTTNIIPEDIHAFGTIATGALQVFYQRIVETSDWPN